MRVYSRLLVVVAVCGVLVGVAPDLRAAEPGQATAVALVKEGKRRFEQGEFAIAATLFLEAYGVDKRATHLFNAARAHEKAGKAREAIELFRRYVAEADDPVGLIEAKALIAALEAEIAKAEPVRPDQGPKAILKPMPEPVPTGAARPTPPPPKAVEPKSRSGAAPVTVLAKPALLPERPVAGWVALGSGAACLVASGVVFVLAASTKSDLDARLATDGAGRITGISYDDAQARHDRIGTQRLVAGVLGGAGVVAAGAGAWLLWLRKPGAVANLVPTAGGLGVMVRF